MAPLFSLAQMVMMHIRKVLPLVGPNIWANYPVLEAWVDLGPLEERPSNTLPGFVDRLTAWLPSMIEHRCSEGVRGGFFMRLRDGTWMGHVLEHVTLELQTLAHLPVGYGRTRETSERGVYRVVVECLDHGFGEACLRAGRELLVAAIDGHAFDVAGTLRRLRDLADRLCLGPSTQAIVSAAKARTIPFLRMTDGNLVQLGYGKNQRRIWAAETNKTCALAESIAQDKELTRQLLHSVGVPMPSGRAVSSREDAWGAAEELGLPVVVKPKDANHGRGVSIRLEDREAVEAAYDIALREGTSVLVERFISGTQHRVLVVGGEAVAASGGEAEQVLADGIHTVEELVAQANLDPERGEGSAQPLTTLVLDDISLELLRRQGLDKTSVPAEGRSVLIHHNGDLTVDETERMHPDVAQSCVIAAQTVGLDVAGIDLIADDIGRPLEEQGGAVIEVNAGPGLVMHLKPLVGKPRPVGEAIVNHLFLTDEDGRIPLVAIAGTNGKTLVAGMVSAMLAAAGRMVGQASSRGLFVGERTLARSDATDAASARRLLVNPFVDAIVLETSEIKVIREGLAFDRCQVAVVTNLGSGDHMGEQYVDDRSLVAKAVRAPVDVVLPEGVAVLNADDPEVAAMAEKCRGRVVYFACDADARPIQDAIARGEDAVFVSAGKVVVAHAGQILNLLDLAPHDRPHPVAMPILLGDVLAAAAAGIALGLTPSQLRQGIEHGLRDPGYAFYAAGQRRVLVTPVSNPSSLAAWTRVLDEAFPMPRHAILEVAPDWREEDAKAIEALLASFTSLCLTSTGAVSQSHDHLFKIIQHSNLLRETSLASAINRISAISGTSDFIFVGPSKRSGADLVDTHLRQRNMVRLALPDLVAVSKPT